MKLEQAKKLYHRDHSIVDRRQYHLIFCPKYRRLALSDSVSARMKEQVLENQEAYGYTVREMEIMPDHVHLLVDIDPRVGVNQVVAKIKGYTSHELRNVFPGLKLRLRTLWTRSKFIAAAGAVTLEIMQQYMANQKGE